MVVRHRIVRIRRRYLVLIGDVLDGIARENQLGDMEDADPRPLDSGIATEDLVVGDDGHAFSIGPSGYSSFRRSSSRHASEERVNGWETYVVLDV
jgi:hypothetical protein